MSSLQPKPSPNPIPTSNNYSSQPDARRRAQLLATGGILLGFALRLHRLGAESLWYDETVSVFLAGQSIPELIAHTARDIHPPAYYLLLHLWGWLAQPSLGNGLEFVYAWPSLFWGILLLPLVYAVGRRFATPRIALVALWLSAVNPYHIWYSQEVRMYTLGAGLGLLCLWAALPWLQTVGETPTRHHSPFAIHHSPFAIHHSPFTIPHSLFLYILSAAAGLYTLYYFAFLLVVLNSLVFWQHFTAHPSPSASRRPLSLWLVANAAAFLLWAPWLPTFWRQISEPPVPVWRYGLDLMTVLQESLAALLVGQSPPGDRLWPWAWAGGVLVALFAFFADRRRDRSAWTLAAFVFLPPLLIVLISLTLTPLYHIRYFFTYTAASSLLVALVLEWALRRWRWLHAAALIGVIAVSGWSLAEFWTNPLYRADDHRGAVAELAQAWRPGDAVLVNAGWVHTVLAVYWPSTPSPTGAQPAEAPLLIRLSEYTKGTTQAAPDEQPIFLTGGSVDGTENLGWGLAESDFYAISQDDTLQALEQVAARHPRIWHYRLYDTVSDPQALIRGWLDANAVLRLDLPMPGRDFLRLQLYETAAFGDASNCPQTSEASVTFGDGMTLRGLRISPAAQAGSSLYATLCWEIGPDVPVEELRTSLRLYRPADGEGGMAAQKDESPFLDVAIRSAHRTALALPIPGATPPGDYRLELIVYDGVTGAPLPIADPRAVVGQRWPLAESVRIAAP